MNKIGLILLFLIFLCTGTVHQGKRIRDSGADPRHDGIVSQFRC